VKTHPKTPCCGYKAKADIPYPVFWNPFNKAVQCHNCGHVYCPESPNRTQIEMRDAVLTLKVEVNCRIEHGAQSEGHLEYIYEKLEDILNRFK
jgi:hypothetical protein